MNFWSKLLRSCSVNARTYAVRLELGDEGRLQLLLNEFVQVQILEERVAQHFFGVAFLPQPLLPVFLKELQVLKPRDLLA